MSTLNSLDNPLFMRRIDNNRKISVLKYSNGYIIDMCSEIHEYCRHFRLSKGEDYLSVSGGGYNPIQAIYEDFKSAYEKKNGIGSFPYTGYTGY